METEVQLNLPAVVRWSVTSNGSTCASVDLELASHWPSRLKYSCFLPYPVGSIGNCEGEVYLGSWDIVAWWDLLYKWRTEHGDQASGSAAPQTR